MTYYLTISQAAAELNVHPVTLREWCRKGRVPFIRLPSGYRRWTPEMIEQIKADMVRKKVAS